MKHAFERMREYFRSHLWGMPTIGVVLAIVLSRVTLALDSSLELDSAFYLFPGGSESARSLLSSIASSMITFTAVVFSVTIIVLQLAANQLSPRVMRTFLRDWLTQLLLGASISTFIFSLIVLSEVTTDQLPAFSTWTSLILALITVLIFISYISHMTQSIRASTIIERVANETRSTVDRLYPHVFEERPDVVSIPPSGEAIILHHDGHPGNVISVDEESLADIAEEHDLTIELLQQVGEFVAHGAATFRIWGNRDDFPEKSLRRAVLIGKDRTMQQDAAFGLRQLVDIAERALSPGINDPTTAAHSLDQIYDILRRIELRDIPSKTRFDEEGKPLILPRPTWEDYVALALDEIQQYGSQSLQIAGRLQALLEELLSVAPPSRLPPLQRRLHHLETHWRDEQES